MLLHRQKERIFAECQAEINRHEFQADYARSLRKLEELHCAQADELQRRDQQLLHGQLWQQNLELREAHQKSLSEMEELKKFQSSTFDTIATRRLVEDQDTIWALTGRIQELQNEVNCMNDSKDFQDAESVRNGHSHVASEPVSFHLIQILVECYAVLWECQPQRRAAKRLGHTSAPYPKELNPWSSGREETIHSSTVEKSEKRTPVQDLRCQSVPSAKKSVIFSGGDSSKNYGADQQRLQISYLHFDNFFPTPATFACWKIRLNIEVCTCSQFPTEAMHWIKEV